MGDERPDDPEEMATLRALGAAIGEADPVPDWLVAAAAASPGLARLDEELLELLDTATAGVRGGDEDALVLDARSGAGSMASSTRPTPPRSGSSAAPARPRRRWTTSATSSSPAYRPGSAASSSSAATAGPTPRPGSSGSRDHSQSSAIVKTARAWASAWAGARVVPSSTMKATPVGTVACCHDAAVPV